MKGADRESRRDEIEIDFSILLQQQDKTSLSERCYTISLVPLQGAGW